MTNIKLLAASLEVIENDFFNTLPVCAIIWKKDQDLSRVFLLSNYEELYSYRLLFIQIFE